MRHVAKAALLAAIVVLIPNLAQAQSLAGTVRDASSAVLPGVTVEAASPALIEKVRTTVSDGTGLYRIQGLTPGIYKLTFTLPGFTTVIREGVEVSGGASNITINAEMRVGGVQETITVTGETPVVDVQTSTRTQKVIDNEVIAAHSGVARIRQHPRDRAWHPGDRAQFRREPGDELLHRARRPRQRRSRCRSMA